MMCNILQQAEMSKTTNKTKTKRHRRGYLISFDWHSSNHVSLLQVVLEMMVNAMTLVTSSLKTVPSSRVPREELCKNQILVKKPNKLE